MLFTLLQADTLNAVQAAPVPQEMTYSLIDMAMKGGWIMIVLLILSIIAIYIFGKKLVQINRAAKVDRNFIDDIRDYIHDGKTKSAIRSRTPATLRWHASRRAFPSSPPSPAAHLCWDSSAP